MNWHWQPNADHTMLGRSADLLQGRKALQQSWQIEFMGWDILTRFNKATCLVLPLGHNDPCSTKGTEWPESCSAEMDMRVLEMSQQHAQVTKKAVASWLVSAQCGQQDQEVIVLQYLALERPCLKCCIEFWVLQKGEQSAGASPKKGKGTGKGLENILWEASACGNWGYGLGVIMVVWVHGWTKWSWRFLPTLMVLWTYTVYLRYLCLNHPKFRADCSMHNNFGTGWFFQNCSQEKPAWKRRLLHWRGSGKGQKTSGLQASDLFFGPRHFNILYTNVEPWNHVQDTNYAYNILKYISVGG